MLHLEARFFLCALLASVAALLSACGGGGGGGSSTSGSEANNGQQTSQINSTSSQTLGSGQSVANSMLTTAGRVGQALTTGNSRQLTPDDKTYLLTTAQDSYNQLLAVQNKVLNDLYAGSISTKFDLVRDSFMVQPAGNALDKVFPLVVGDNGNVLASISTVGGGRIAGYGYDIVASFDASQTRIVGWDPVNSVEFASRQMNHQPLFKRVLAWLVRGNASADITTSSATPFYVAWGSLPTSSTVMFTTPKVYEPYAASGLRSLGVKFSNMSCDPLSAPVNDCAGHANLVVIGALDRRLANDIKITQLKRIQEIVQAKIPILYLNSHPDGGSTNDYARSTWPEDIPRLDALGFASGETPDKRNYYIKDSVAADRTLEQTKQKANILGGVINSLVTGSFPNYSWPTGCNELKCAPADFVSQFIAPAAYLKGATEGLSASQLDVFDSQNSSNLLKSLVLWADVYRQSIPYPLNKTGNQADFQKAYLADSLVAYVRSAGAGQDAGTAAGQGIVGNFLGSEAKSTPTSTDFETITVTLPGSSGFTAIGRFALPGVPVQVKLASLPTAGSNFTFFFNPIRPGSTKVWETPSGDRDGYRRPLFLQSPNFSLSTDAITLVSPYGGTLQLGFSGAGATTSVTLQIKGTAKHPFYDTTQGTPDAATFFAAVKASKLGWMEIKTPGLEVHSLISNAMGFLQPSPTDNRNVFPTADKPYYDSKTGINMTKYLDEAKTYVMEDAYQLAGFQARGLTLSASVQSFCNNHGWDCTSTSIHAPPTVQHYVSDIRANCGSMCSGQPIDSSTAFDPRHWGESHELGHNLQAFKVYDGSSGEVSNNIFPLHKKWRLFRELGRDALGYSDESQFTQTIFDLIKTTYKDSTSASRDAKIAKVRAELWTDGGYAAQNWSRLYFYLQWPLIYYEVLKEANPTWTDSQAWAQAWDIYTLMYLYLRQLNAAPSDANWSSVKGKFGFGLYASKPSTANADSAGNFPIHDVMLVGLSLITGRNQTSIFDLWGVTTSVEARNQAAAIKASNGNNVPAQSVNFYAVVCFDDYRTYAAIDLNAANPGFPASWGVTPFANATTNINACTNVTNAYDLR